MNAEKHTPGPWHEGRVVATGLPIKLQMRDQIWWPREESDEEAQANLRLMDHAPDLLRELQRCVALLHPETDEHKAAIAVIASAIGAAA